MKIIKNNLQETEITCDRCHSVISYNKLDIHTKWTKWSSYERAGIDKSVRFGKKFIVCPLCKNEIIIEKMDYYF